jgi:hypothetical protein
MGRSIYEVSQLLALATRTNENGEAGCPTSPSTINDTFGYGVQVPVVQLEDDELPALQASFRTTGAEAPVQVMVDAPVVRSAPNVPTVAPEPFLRVKAPPAK